MKTRESQGFFCVVYLITEKKTVYFHKVWKPSKLAEYYKGKWLWIKCYINKQDYYTNTKATNYYAIFDKNNIVTDFTYQQFSKNIK